MRTIKYTNQVSLVFPSRSANESFARSAAAAFAAQLDPTLDELGDVKTAVSEAVTNAIVHAYPDSLGTVSYTHLDVYKRQFLPFLREKFSPPLDNFPGFSYTIF